MCQGTPVFCLFLLQTHSPTDPLVVCIFCQFFPVFSLLFPWYFQICINWILLPTVVITSASPPILPFSICLTVTLSFSILLLAHFMYVFIYMRQRVFARVFVCTYTNAYTDVHAHMQLKEEAWDETLHHEVNHKVFSAAKIKLHTYSALTIHFAFLQYIFLCM